MAYDYYSAYGSLASYFGQSGGTGSPGKAGGAGYNNDISQGQGSTGDAQSPSASSGSAWISAAASSASTDKSIFTTPFSQQFGGITNNQIIESPGAYNAASAPVLGPPVVGNQVPGYGQGNPLTIAIIAAIVGVIALKFLK